MAASSVVLQNTGTRLLVTLPGTSLLRWWLLLVFAIVVAAALLGMRHSIHKLNARYPGSVSQSDEQRGNWLIPACFVAFCIFFWAVTYTSGSLLFDRATGTVTITSKMTAFLPARSQSVPLSNVQDATLDAKPNSRRIRLEMIHGSDVAFPIWSDRDGQDEAVKAINGFLHSAGQP